jgi:hypothetical protein
VLDPLGHRRPPIHDDEIIDRAVAVQPDPRRHAGLTVVKPVVPPGDEPPVKR